MLKLFLTILSMITAVMGGYHCRSATDCTVTCSNFKGEVPKPWIAVPWSTGHCYFHNTETREDRDTLPNIRKEYKRMRDRYKGYTK